MKLYAISDIHTDFIDNWNLIKQIGNYNHDALIVAGDIADNLDVINRTFDLLQHKFKYVFYIPGIMNYGLGIINMILFISYIQLFGFAEAEVSSPNHINFKSIG